MKHSSYIPAMIMVMVLVSGCMGSLAGYRNYTVKEANRIDLAEENREVRGIWSTGDLSLSYEYLLGENTLKIRGRLTLASKLTHFTVMDHLRFRVHFVDSGGMITGSRVVYASPYREWIPRLTLSFSRLLPVPSGSVALAFSYSGKVGEGGGEEGLMRGATDWEFWRSP